MERVFSFTFRFALASIIETSIVSFGLDRFLSWVHVLDAVIRLTVGVAHPIMPNRSRLLGLVEAIFAFGTVASSVHLATC